MKSYLKKIILPSIYVFCFLFTAASQTPAADYLDGVDAYNNGDYETALKEWKELAEKGNVAAQKDLGFMYSKGQGVALDYAQAFAWYTVAVSQGNEAARRSREIISEEMSQDKIARGKELAKQLYKDVYGGQLKMSK